MNKTLLSWIGNTDLSAAQGNADAGLGPIGQGVAARSFRGIVLLSDHKSDVTTAYKHWLQQRTKASVSATEAKLSGPTEFGEIYQHAVRVVQQTIREGTAPESLVFHLSPGTPAMAAVWIILAKTRFPAELIESSKKAGVRTVSIPFDIAAEFIPDLLRKPDEELIRLAQGLPPDAPEFADIIHQSSMMKALILKARKIAPRNIPVLIEGESGTGKELFANAIHNASARKDKPFVAVNCGAIPAELVESELFGHMKGSFTHATADHRGYIEQASGGTLFLDEVGELPLAAQVKLLRVLQNGEVRPVGASKPRRIDVRIIAATNRKLLEEVANHRFREDLFHRLAVAILWVPPLRERGGDLGLLVNKLLDKVNADASSQPGYQHKTLSPGAKNLLIHHPWPGNVRELINTLQRAAVWSAGDRIEDRDVREALLPFGSAQSNVLGRPMGEGFALTGVIEEVAKDYLSRAMTDARGNRTEAAKLLGFNNYQTLNNWLKKYNVKP